MNPTPRSAPRPLPSDFAEVLESRLPSADRARKRQVLRAWLGRLMLLILLVGPLLSWRLTMTGSGDRHLTVHTLSWITFLLNVGTRVNGQILTSLHLQSLPTIAGVVLLLVVATGLLWVTGEEHE